MGEKRTLAGQISHSRGRLNRLEREQRKAQGHLRDITRNLTAGGVLLLVGTVALITYFLMDIKCTALVAIVALCVGGLMTVTALVKTSRARSLITATTVKITHAQGELDGLKVQALVQND